MESTAEDNKLAIFDRHRSRLFGIAYRMLGTPDEAEEIVQDAYIRWHTTDISTIQSAEAWLVSTTTRLSIDRLRKASRQRETYIGPWLPEPLMISSSPSPHEDVELASSLSTAFMLMLERLSPAERAVLLLHDVFDSSYSDIARIMERENPQFDRCFIEPANVSGPTSHGLMPIATSTGDLSNSSRGPRTRRMKPRCLNSSRRIYQ